MADATEVLSGGNASGAVVRIGNTVRKTWEPNTDTVHSYLTALGRSGAPVPAPLGRDEQGRQVLEFVPGQNALGLLPLSLSNLHEVGRLVRCIHEASEGFDISNLNAADGLLPVAKADLMCHNDLAPWNLIVGERLVFIDWDGAAPSTRLWDLAYSAQAFSSLVAGQPVTDAAARLRAFVDGYEPDDALRAALPDAMTERTLAMFDMLERANKRGIEPWGTMYLEGHGEHWRNAADYVRQHRANWVDALAEPGLGPAGRAAL